MSFDKHQEAPPPYSAVEQNDPPKYPPQAGYPGQQGYNGMQGQQGYGAPGQQGYGVPPNYPGAGQYPPSGYAYGHPGQSYNAYGQPASGAIYTPQPPYHTQVVVTQPMVAHPPTGTPPADHMAAAICVTLCCFWPTGIFAIMRASESRSAVARGDMPTAHAQARSARTMIHISIVVGIISIVLFATFIGVYYFIVLRGLARH